MKQNPTITYDFTFIGLGASNSLILLSLIQKGLLKNKNVAIFEVESKTTNDKTFCFWSGPDEPIVSDLAPIISHRFNSIKVSQSESQNIELQPYHYIRSIDLYNYTLQKLNEEGIKIFRLGVNQITCENEVYTLQTNKAIFKTHYIFDSRPPSMANLAKKDIYLDQSFYGLHIKCVEDVFQNNTFEMMNFDVDQDDYTQFVYIIPFSSNEALVELTRFGKEKIDIKYALQVLENFISRKFGKFETLTDEKGCIPMTTYINPPHSSSGILHTGASANLIKPSTGYGFKKMHAFAQIVSERIETNDLVEFNKIGLDAKRRFRFYDKLLLLILMYWPSKGKLIFTRLFEKQSALTVFSFLDEKSSFVQEVKIFVSLPIVTFLKALYLHFKKENLLRYICAFLSVVIYFFILSWIPQFTEYYNYSVLIIGLLFIGIPHGALDHMLLKHKSSSLYQFVFKYLLIIGLYYLIWQIFPLLALIVFIIYSSFHFGESELIESEIKIDSLRIHLKAFLIGLSVLLFIIFSHQKESFSVISNFITIPPLIYSEFTLKIISSGITVLCLVYLLLQMIISKKRNIGLIFVLVIGVKVPLILAFGLYFIFQHSFNAWQHLKIGLNKNSMQLYKKSAIYTLGALVIFLLIIAFDLNKVLNMKGLIANFFIFIACISLPHFFLMHLFYKNES